MVEMSLPPVLSALAQRGRIDADDVLSMRREVFKDGVVSRFEAESLFRLNEAVKTGCEEWSEFFIDALTDHVVHQVEPRGYVSEDDGRWLMDHISHDGVVDTRQELELLVKIIETAKQSPDLLVAFALRQVKFAVVKGEGAVAKGVLTPGVIGAAEVELLRRILYGYGGDGHVAITQSEAEVLFDINDSTIEAQNDPSWTDLFTKAITNYLMFVSGYAVPSREEALRRSEWLDERRGVGAFMSEMASGILDWDLRSMFDNYRVMENRWKEHNDLTEQRIADAEQVTEAEAKWLAERIGRDGMVHANETALLRLLQKESPDLHPQLRSLLEPAA